MDGTRTVQARKTFIVEGEAPQYVHIVKSGFACRYKVLPDRGRSIVGFLIPGDICDLDASILGAMDHSVRALSSCEVICLNCDKLYNQIDRYPILNHALRRLCLVNESILREWVVSTRHRSAEKQLAHLFCEFMFRLDAIGLVSQNSYHLPLTQGDLGETAGLSSVHVNRVLQKLRSEGLIEFKDKRVYIPNIKNIIDFSGFKPNYLYLSPDQSQLTFYGHRHP
jgi:CRP-like cAMP-binding protein